MTDFGLTILSTSERHKAVVRDHEVEYYVAAVSSSGEITWRLERIAQYTLPRHVMLDVVIGIVNDPRIKRGR